MLLETERKRNRKSSKVTDKMWSSIIIERANQIARFAD